MQHSQLKISLVAFSSVVVFILINSKFESNDKQSSVERAVERQPSSTSSSFTTARVIEKKSIFQNQTFLFDRRLKATLDQKNILTDIHYQGKMHIEWIDQQKEERTGRFSFEVNDSTIPSVLAEVRLNREYQLLSIKVPEYETENEENAILFLKDLISIYAFQTFEDTTGKYEANLNKTLSKSNETVWVKNKFSYVNPAFSDFKFKKSIHEIHLNQDFVEASGFEESQKGELSMYSVYQLKLSKEEVVKFSSNPAQQMKLVTITTNPNQSIKVKASWPLLESKLLELVKLKGQERLHAFHAALTMLKSNPQLLDQFMEWSKTELNDPLKSSVAIGLLATLGTKEAQHELVSMYQQDKNQNVDQAHLILNSFATNASNLSMESRGLLNSVLDQHREHPELAANAAYALGAAGDVKKITELAKQSTSIHEKIIYIDAIGNSGSLESLPFLLESSQSTDPVVREKAIFALRFVNDSRVKTVFEQSINDPNLSVRVSVVKAVPFQANPHEYDVMLKNCTDQSLEQSLKKLCSQTLADL